MRRVSGRTVIAAMIFGSVTLGGAALAKDGNPTASTHKPVPAAEQAPGWYGAIDLGVNSMHCAHQGSKPSSCGATGPNSKSTPAKQQVHGSDTVPAYQFDKTVPSPKPARPAGINAKYRFRTDDDWAGQHKPKSGDKPKTK